MNDVMERLQFALELQQNADATQKKINPNGEITYQDMLSFHATGVDVYCGPLLASNSGIGLTTTNCGFTNPSLDSDSVSSTSRAIFTDNSKTKT